MDDVIGEHRHIYRDNTLPDEINRMCLTDTRMFLPGLNLAYTDRASMAASVEVRVPFVDPVVARAAFSIEGSAKIQHRRGKVALKQAAESWLPHEIVHRPKASFSVPLRAWVRNDLRDVIQDVLVRGDLVGSGMIRREPLLALIEGARAARTDPAAMAAAHARAVAPARPVHGRNGLAVPAPVRCRSHHRPEETMKQVAQNYKTGELSVLDVQAPACRPGGVLVRSRSRLISTGTEMMKLTEAKLSMVGKARPAQIRCARSSTRSRSRVPWPRTRRS